MITKTTSPAAIAMKNSSAALESRSVATSHAMARIDAWTPELNETYARVVLNRRQHQQLYEHENNILVSKKDAWSGPGGPGALDGASDQAADAGELDCAQHHFARPHLCA